MRTILALLLAFVCASASAQHSAQGTLSGAAQGDFNYLPAMAKPASALQQGQAIKLQSRFVWNGSTGGPIGVDQHAIVAYTQTAATAGMVNTAGQILWTHGVGAIVGPFGLGLELWFRRDANGNGYEDDTTDALVWTQQNGRCVGSVLGSIPKGALCLSATPNGGSYLTPASFTLKTGFSYWLRVAITPIGGGLATLYADLIDDQATANPVQSGMVTFQIATFFPLQQPLSATMARIAAAPGQPDIQYMAFDYGF